MELFVTKWNSAINERRSANIFQYVKSLKIHDFVNGLLSFLRNIPKNAENIKRRDGSNMLEYVISLGKISFKSNILGRKRNKRTDIVSIENCIIQCVLSIFSFFTILIIFSLLHF